MGRYLLSLQRFWGTALAGQLEYQVNMLIDLVAMVGSLAGSIFVLSVFFGQGRDLGGWSWEAALVVQGIYTFSAMLENLLRRTESNSDHAKSVPLQALRILKAYGLAKEPQLEMFSE